MKKNLKFIIGASVIIVSIIYLGVTGFKQDMSYYKTVEEVYAMGENAHNVKLRVAGSVVPGSIERDVSPIVFKIKVNEAVMPVVYVGEGPVPDTFQDECETVVRGVLTQSGVFEAEHIQAKCASKYEKRLEEVSAR